MIVVSLALFTAWYIRFQTTLLGVGVDNWGVFEYLLSLIFILVLYTLLKLLLRSLPTTKNG